MKTIPLTKGKVALVDDADYEFLSQWKWCALQPAPPHGTYYAARREHGTRKHVYMHNVLLGVVGVDHKDRRGLNNCRDNLRACSSSLNNGNARMHRDNRSGYKGIWFDGRGRVSKPWCASTQIGGKTYRLGYFATAKEAALAYDAKARELFGSFARTNADLGLL